MVRLLVVGSGDAFHSGGARHSCYWLERPGRSAVMIDFGATALQGLLEAGRDPRALGAIVLTHLHGDHIGGIAFLLIDAMFARVRLEPLVVFGPVGTGAAIDAQLRVHYGELVGRERPFRLEIHELAPGARASHDGVEIEAFAASHMDPPDQPLCLRLGVDGRRIAFSGDTELCDGLVEAAAGTDLLVAELSGMAPPIGRHSTWEGWRELLPTIGARRVLFSHLGEPVRAAAAEVLAEGSRMRPIALATDGLWVDP